MQQYMPQFNPYMTARERLSYMEQQYPQFTYNQQPQHQQNNINLITIPVSNIDEANAFRVDLNGTPTFFYNAGKNEIYMKRTNLQTGDADFQIFNRVKQAPNDIKENLVISNYEKDFKTLNDKIDGLYSLLTNSQSKMKDEKVIMTKEPKNVK